MAARLVALVSSKASPIHERRVRHYVGSVQAGPGEVLIDEELPWPRVLLIRRGTEAGFLLYRYTRDAQFAGDTWHMTLDEAKDQADFEFSECLGPWREVPEGVTDPIAFALQEVEVH